MLKTHVENACGNEPLPSSSDENVDELRIESHVDPWIQTTVERLQPKQPSHGFN